MWVFAVSFAVYTLLIVGVGLLSARKARKSDEDYFLAGRSLGPWIAALSASASSESGWVTLGLVGWAFTSGMTAYWIIPGCLLGFMFNWWMVAGRLRERAASSGALTLPDLFAFAFNERLPLLRTLSVVVILVAMLLYVAAQFAAAGDALQTAFGGVSYQTGVLLGAGIVLAYTALGGFRAACWTDFAQALVMVGTLVVFPVFLLLHNGGFEFVRTSLEPADPALLRFWPTATGPALLGFLLGSGAMGINFGYPGQPHVLVRFMALRDRRDAWIGGVISVVWATLVYWGAVTVGLMVRAMTESDAAWTASLASELATAPDTAGQTGLVLAAMHLIPGALSGMVLAAVLAAICSTADSQLVVAASSGANDIYARLIERSGKTAHMVFNRSILLALGVGAVLLVIDERVQVFKFVLTYGWAILGASFGPQVLLLLFWKRASYAGCLCGMLVGFGVALGWPWVYDAAEHGGVEIYNLPLAFVAALLANAIVSVFTPPAHPRPTEG